MTIWLFDFLINFEIIDVTRVHTYYFSLYSQLRPTKPNYLNKFSLLYYGDLSI